MLLNTEDINLNEATIPSVLVLCTIVFPNVCVSFCFLRSKRRVLVRLGEERADRPMTVGGEEYGHRRAECPAPDDGPPAGAQARISRANVRHLIRFHELRHRRLTNDPLATSALFSLYRSTSCMHV